MKHATGVPTGQDRRVPLADEAGGGLKRRRRSPTPSATGFPSLTKRGVG